ncbi:MAG TPA: YggT family protein [Gemmatimonadaceae bacterium]|nr:YggT family protein [Gemmatimonadaceae bacterium]
MPGILIAFDLMIAVVRQAVFVIAAVALVVFGVDWLVRTRRINPFNPIARFYRRGIHPVMLPVERRIVRAGGMPTSAPWWTLVGVVIGGILLIVLLGFARSVFASAMIAASSGGAGIYYLVISWTFGILQAAVLVRVISSWLRLPEWKWWLRWSVVLSEPILRPLRRIIPPFGMMDVTPIVAWFGLWIIEGLLLGRL